MSSAVPNAGIVLNPPNVVHRIGGQPFERCYDPLPTDVEKIDRVANLPPGSQVQQVHGTVIGGSDGWLYVDVEPTDRLSVLTRNDEPGVQAQILRWSRRHEIRRAPEREDSVRGCG